MANNDLSVYIDINILDGWASSMETINGVAISDLQTFIDTTIDIEDSWKSNSSSSTVNSICNDINSAILCHENMKDLKKFLLEVITTAENE